MVIVEEKKNNHEVKQEEKYEPLPVKVGAFDEKAVQAFQELSQRNNELAALVKQEEQTRIQLINLKKAITDLELEKEFKIEDIIVPMGGFQRHLKKEEKSKFIQHHIDSFHMLENQYVGIVAQRKHREDEFNESTMRTLKYLWQWTLAGHKLKDKELFEKVNTSDGNELPMADRLPTILRDNKTLDELVKKAKELK